MCELLVSSWKRSKEFHSVSGSTMGSLNVHFSVCTINLRKWALCLALRSYYILQKQMRHFPARRFPTDRSTEFASGKWKTSTEFKHSIFTIATHVLSDRNRSIFDSLTFITNVLNFKCTRKCILTKNLHRFWYWNKSFGIIMNVRCDECSLASHTFTDARNLLLD